MVAYSFKGRFEDRIRARSKIQTIRKAGRKRHTRPGERLTLTTGDRFHPRQIGSAVCESVRGITLYFGTAVTAPMVAIQVEGEDLGETITGAVGLDAFAEADGFADWQALEDFWRETHAPLPPEWCGLLIRWGDTFEPAP